MEEKKKRGRPKKIRDLVKQVVEEIIKTTPKEKVPTSQEILAALDEYENSIEKEIQDVIQEEKLKHKQEWDVTIDDEINFFDATLSYELTGYKPIDATHGLDFDPSWFTETRDTYNSTGHYCLYPRKTKAFGEFWDEQYKRCRNGLTRNGYTITGDHYFFLNFYQLDILTGTDKAGGGRNRNFPAFFVELYKYFHYLELCKRLRKNCVLMKARGVGQH